MLADKKSVATVEVGPEGKFSIEQKDNGCIYHTNHYILEDMLGLNKKIGVSSQKRYDRIGQLLSEGDLPYTFDEFWLSAVTRMTVQTIVSSERVVLLLRQGRWLSGQLKFHWKALRKFM